MRTDSCSNCVLPFVYIMMIIGNLAYIFLIFKPEIDKYVHQKTIAFPTRMVVEFVIFEFFNCMMVWSHLATMCVEPGFVPYNYQYKDAKLPLSYKIGLNKEIIMPVNAEDDEKKRAKSEPMKREIQPDLASPKEGMTQE